MCVNYLSSGKSYFKIGHIYTVRENYKPGDWHLKVKNSKGKTNGLVIDFFVPATKAGQTLYT